MSAVIRPAVPGDHDAVRQIVMDAYGPWVARVGKKPGPMLDDYERRIAEQVLWVLDAGGTIVGLMMLEEEADCVLLKNVAVAPACHGQGHGRALVAFAEQETMRRGHRTLRLYTNARMTENVSLYRRLGFVETGRVTFDGFDRVLMAKALP